MWGIVFIILLILGGMEFLHRYIVYCIQDYNSYIKHPENHWWKSSSDGWQNTPGEWDDQNLWWSRIKRWLIKHLSWKSKKV